MYLLFARAILPKPSLSRGEVFFPLHVYVCNKCFLVQLEEYESPENIFAITLTFLHTPTRG